MVSVHRTNRRGNLEIGRLPEPQDIHVGEKHFRKKITDAGKRYIPAEYIPEIRSNFPTEALELPDKRDAPHVTTRDDPRIKTLSSAWFQENAQYNKSFS